MSVPPASAAPTPTARARLSAEVVPIERCIRRAFPPLRIRSLRTDHEPSHCARLFQARRDDRGRLGVPPPLALRSSAGSRWACAR